MRNVAIAGWILTALWFVSILIGFAGWSGPALPFLYWTAPALPLYLFTWWWLKRDGRPLPQGSGSAVVLGWATIGIIAWYTFGHPGPFDRTSATLVITVAFPLFVTTHAMSAIYREPA